MLFSPWLSTFRRKARRQATGSRRLARREDRLQMRRSAELLETRTLLTSPEFVSVSPNVGEFLRDGDVREESPQELLFQFSPGQVLDNSTLGAIQLVAAGHDGGFRPASVLTDFDSGGLVTLRLGTQRLGSAENDTDLTIASSDLGVDAPPTILGGSGALLLTLNTNATTPTTAQDLLDLVANDTDAAALLTVEVVDGDVSTDISGASPATLTLLNAGAADVVTDLGTGTDLRLQIAARSAGLDGNDITVQINRLNLSATPVAPQVSVTGNRIEVVINDGATTTAQTLVNAIAAEPDADALVSATVAVGDPSEDVSGLQDGTMLRLAGADRAVSPGYVDIADTTNEVIYRFAETLPDDAYRIQILGTGASPLQNAGGEEFGNGTDHFQTFSLDLGSQTTAVVPQPILREQLLRINDEGGLTSLQDGDTITIDPNVANFAGGMTDLGSPGSGSGGVTVVYEAVSQGAGGNGVQVTVDTADLGEFGTPTVDVVGRTVFVTLNSHAVAPSTAQDFADAINADLSARALVDVQLQGDAAFDVGTALSMTDTQVLAGGFDLFTFEINDTAAGPAGVRSGSIAVDVDLTADDPATVAGIIATAITNETLSNPDVEATATGGIVTIVGGSKDVRVTTATADADAVTQRAGGIVQRDTQIVVYFNDDDLDITSAVDPDFYQLIDTNGAAAGLDPSLDHTTDTVAVPDSVIFDKSARTATLVFNSGIAGGTYRLRVGVSDLPVTASPLTHTPADDDNSSFDTATDLTGTLGLLSGTEFIVSSQIEPQPIPLPPLPGGQNEPGHREIQVEAHIGSTGTTPVAPGPISVINYNFQDVIGSDPQGNTLFNLITEEEKDRAREIFEIYASYLGLEAVETPSSGILVATGDMRAVNPLLPVGPGAVAGVAGGGKVVMDPADTQGFPGADQYGGAWFGVALHEIGHAIGLGHSYDIPSVQGAGIPNDVYPGDHDIVHGLRLYRDDSTDIDMYQVDIPETGIFSAEIFAERLATSSLLNSAISLYDDNRDLIARNDDYFSNDAFLELELTAGTYFVGVTSTGNLDFDPTVSDSGSGGITDGAYELHLNLLRTPADDEFLADATGSAFDGDADGKEGGAFDFWFQATDTSDETLFVDKSAITNLTTNLNSRQTTVNVADVNVFPEIFADPTGFAPFDLIIDNEQVTVTAANPVANQLTVVRGVASTTRVSHQAGAVLRPVSADGTIDDPFGLIERALVDADTRNTDGSGTNDIDLIRIVGNGGADNHLGTITDSRPYLVGFDDDGDILEDGAEFIVPQDVTVMIDQGAVLKLQNANIEVGSSSDIIDRSGAALQVLGTPDDNVIITTNGNDAIGGDTDGVTDGANPGDWGGIVFRNDSDYEADGVFLNFVGQSDISYGGGLVNVDSVQSVYSPVHAISARPTVMFNTITFSADAAISANPNSFEEGFFVTAGMQNADYTLNRVGPDIHGNVVTDNSLNGLFVRVDTQFGKPIDKVDVAARFDDTDIVHIITENVQITGNPGGPSVVGGVRTARLSGKLQVDEGAVVKLAGSRIEAEHGGGDLIIEGTSERPVILTSIYDDNYGAGGTFDTSGNGATRGAAAGDWGGLVLNAGSSASIDNAYLAYGGGLVPIAGDFDNFNLIEVRQASLRLTNSLVENNANGRASSSRNGRGSNDSTTIFVNGAQPVIVNNDFTGNSGSVISINANSLIDDIIRDPGRSTGPVDAFSLFPGNQGPLIRWNAYDNNTINGMDVRGETITTSTVWDDTDIVHVLSNEVLIPDFHTSVGVRLESSPTESLVVKLTGGTAGFTATGRGLDIDDRIGGIVQIIGQPLQPVVLTSLADDTIGAGFRLDGLPQSDTNNDVDGSSPSPGDWRSVRLERLSHDRNVDIRNETESVRLAGDDANRSPLRAELLGDLAPDENNGDENRRLGFEIYGAIADDSRADVDVYSFRADAGTEVWIDLDETDPTLNSVVELVDALGRVLVRSSNPTPNNNVVETFLVGGNPAPIAHTLIKDARLGGDFYTSNPNDAGFRVILPGVEGTTGTFFVRVRSNSGDLSNVTGGETTGYYRLQVRVNQVDDEPGSTIRSADIRYATDGIEVIGLPVHSPLLGESAEDGRPNNSLTSFQQLGNLLTSDRNTISVAGDISAVSDIDFYQFELGYEEVQSIGGVNDGGKAWSSVFDIDWADGLSRPDTTLAVYDSTGSLIFVSRDSNIEDDQAGEGQGNDFDDISRGSAGELDPFIGSVMMPAGIPGSPITYYVAVSHSSRLPTALNATFAGTSTNTTVRLEPVTSITRVVEDHIGFSGYSAGDPALGTIPIDPVTPTIIDIADTMTLSAHVTPFTFGDVQLFIDNGGSLISVNPATGDTNYTIGDINGSGVGYGDITMRWDGVLFGQTAFGNTATGNYRAIDLGSATQINLGDDGFGINPNNNGTGASWDALAFSYNTNNDTFDGWAFNNNPSDNDNDATNGIGNQAGLYEINASTGAAVDEVGNAAGHQAFRSVAGYTGLTGEITGMAFTGITGGTLLGVDDDGNLWDMFATTQEATDITGMGVGFTGLTNGPQNLLIDLDADGVDDSLADVFFATGDDGQLWAFDSTGVLFDVWDTDDDLVADSPVLDLGLGAGTRGVTFSTLDYNLWHPTMNRSGDAGHGVNSAFDLSRNPAATNVSINGRNSTEGSGGASFYFGMEQYQNNPGNDYFIYGVNSQYGVQSSVFQQAASSAARPAGVTNSVIGGPIRDSYNFPGGAFGSLTTNPFSLEDYDALDRPTLYFNYFIDTQGTNSGTQMRDAARVLVSTDGGATYSLLATNNSVNDLELPAITSVNSQYTTNPQQRVQEIYDDGSDTDGWRQARVDLGDFAGQSDLSLRFDFSTAGSASISGDITTADVSMPAETETGALASRNRGQENDFEGFYIDDIIVGFAERGEMITNGTSGLSTYFVTPDDPDSEEVTAGTYQLELRRGTEYGANLTESDPEIFVFPIGDTNARLTKEATFFAPSGAAIADGDVFSMSDGVHTIEFEFDNDSTVGTFDLNGVMVDRIAISFDGGVSAGRMANRVAAAVNDVNNQLPQLVPDFDVIASSITTSDQVELAGVISIDATFTPVDLTVSVTADSIAEVAGNSTVTVTREDPTSTFAGDLVVDLFAEDIPQGINVGTSFTASTLFTDSNSIPPDTMAAVGTTQIVESINGNFEIFDRTGASLVTVSQPAFWEAVQPGLGNGQFDPRIIFDPTYGATGRYIAAAIDRGTAGPTGRGGNSIYLAVSDDDTLVTDGSFSDWTAVSFLGDTIDGTRFVDYDTLGVDANGIYISTNNFDAQFDVSVFSLPKTDLVAGSIANLTRFEALNAGTYGSAIQPAVDFGPDDGRGVVLSASGSGRITRFDILGADGPGATLSTPVDIPVPAYAAAPQARQPGPNDNIENVSPRITSNVMEVGDSLWAVHAVLDPVFGGSAIRWYEIDETNNNLLQTGLINDPELDFYDASIAANANGDVVIGFSGSGDNQFISAYAVTGTTDAGVTTFGIPQVMQAGAAEYTVDFGSGRVRWGDYSATVVDPLDPNVFWTFQEFADTANRWSINASQVSLGTTGSDELEILDMAGGSVISQITIPDGMASATFTVSGLNDGVADGSQSVLITGVANSFNSVTDVVDVFDSQIQQLTLTIDPDIVSEVTGVRASTGTVSRNTAVLSNALTVYLVSSDESEISVPSTVVIPAGERTATFDLDTVNELTSDGTQTVTVFATSPGFVNGSDTIDVEADALNASIFDRLGDRNLHRDQGQLIIRGNTITNIEDNGLHLDFGARDFGTNFAHPGSPRNLPTLNSSNLSRGVTVENNVIADFGANGVVISGESTNLLLPLAAIPFAKVVNNTVVGNPDPSDNPRGVGIRVEQNSAPTLLNNIVANTTTGILVDGSSSATVVGTSLYQGNTTNANGGFAGSNSIALANGDPLFVNSLNGNYYLASGSSAIDSSLNTLGDRPAITSVTDTIGIVPSDIFAPDVDIFGQLRIDEPSQSPPPGLGSDIFKDRGAIERADFIGGVATLFVPLDNGTDASTGPDLDPQSHVAHINNPPFFNQFVVKLDDAGIGIDDSTVLSDGSQFTLTRTTRDGTQTLVGTFTGDPSPPANLDYFFTYNTNTNEAIITSVTLFDSLARYQLTVDNDPVTGILDLAGNALVANRGDGSVTFDILATSGPNVPPVNTVPLGVIEIDENVVPFPSSLALSAANGLGITVDDVDAFLGTNELSVTLTVSNDGSPQGTLTLPAGSSSLVTFLQGAEDTPSGILEIVGDIAALNTVLDGLVFTPRLNYIGTATLTVATNDLGNFGFPRDDDMTDIDVIEFNVVEAVLPPGFDIDLLDAAPSGPLMVSEAGSMDTFEVVLRHQPLPGTEVVFTITTDDASESSVTSSISFDEFDWNMAKTVTVTGVDDDFDDGDITSVITIAVDDTLTTDRRYRDDVRAPDQMVTVVTTDDEEADFTVDLLDAAPAGPLTVSEDGSVSDTFTVVLDARPAIGTQVVLTLTPSDSGEASVDQATLTFNDANWDMAQTVTVSGVDDDFDDGSIASFITVAVDTVNTTAPAFLDPNQSDPPGSIAPQTVDVVTTDDDEADFTIDLLDAAPSGPLVVSEDGTTLTDTFTVVLDARPIPGTQVVISITPDDTTEISPIASLTFDTNNWDMPQTVTVTGADDFLDEGNVNSMLTVAVDTVNTDAPAFLDPNQADAPAAVASQMVSVTTLDDDEADFTIDLLGAPGNILTVSEDGVSVTDTFTLVLDTQPASGTVVVLSITPSDPTEVSTPVSVSFDEFDWDMPKTVTVTGVDDFFDDGDDPTQITVAVDTVNTTAPAYLDPNQSDPPPSVAAQFIDVVTTDDDEADFTIDLLDAAPSGPLTVSEDGTTTTDTFTVVLNARPISGTQVVLTITPNDATEVSTTMSLTFDTNDWDMPQTVNVTGVDDDLDDGDILSTVTVAVDTVNTTAPAFLNPNQGDAPASVAPQDVSVLTEDDDEAGFTVDLLGAPGGVLTVAEDGTLLDTFTVVLDSQPESGTQVTLALNANDVSEASVAPFLTFDEFDWDTPKIVTVSGVNDFFDDGDIASTITVAVDTLRTTSPTYLDPNQGDPPASVPPQNIDVLTLDDDTAGVSVDELDGVTVAESGTVDSFEVRLDAQPLPGTIVVVTYTSGDTGEATVSPASFTFNTTNWSIPRTVMVTGVDDRFDDGDILTQVAVAVDDGMTTDPAFLDPGKTPDQSVDVTTTDDDTADFTIDLLDSAPAGTLTVSEDGTQTDSFTVVLNARPTPGTQVVLSITPSDPSEVSATASLTFDSDDWDMPQTVSVAGLDDQFDDGDIDSILTVAVDTGSTDAPAFLDPDQGAPPAMVAPQTVDVRTTDDDTAGFTLDLLGAPGNILTVSEDGTQTDSFTIVLDARPLPGTQVTLSIVPTDATEGLTMSSPVTFDTNNWDMPQTVMVSGVDDIDVDGDITAAFTVSIAAGVTTDPSFNDPGKTAPQNVAFTNLDDEVAEFDIVESGGSSLVSESGTTDTFTVVLRDRPLTNVTLSVTSTDTGEVSVDKSTLTFTPSNWDTPQTVTVTGVDEPTVDGDQIVPVRVAVVPGSSHPLFHMLSPKDVDVTVTDDETASFSVTEPVDGTFPVTTVSESRTSDTLSVVLGAQPETDVVLTVMISDPTEATLNAAQLRFTFANWNVPQQIVVTGVDDPVVDGPQTSMLTVSVNPALSNDFFDVLTPQMFDVTTLDNDSGRFLVSSPTSSTVSEDATSATFLVVLQDQPASDVVLDVASDDTTETSVDQSMLTFTSMNWDQPQTVTVTGVDDAIIDGAQRSTITVSVNVAASDDQFDGALPAGLSFSTTDNDVAGFTVTESGGSTAVDESGTTDTFTVVLDTAPSSDVVFSITASDTDEATVDLGMLTFTSMNWDQPQTVTVTGADDDVVDGTALSSVTVSVVDAASNIAFRSLPDATVSVSTTDDEVPGFTITESSGSSDTSESGSTDSFTVVLDAKPQSDVVLTVSSSDVDSLSATPASLTYTPDNWDTPQTVDLVGLDDGIVNGDRNVDVVVAVAAGTSDPGFSAVGSQTVSVSVADDDVPGLLINGPMGGLEVNENGTTDTFTVELTAQPLTDVVLDVTSGDPGEVSASPSQLTFTPDNWNSPQTVTVAGVDDMDDDGDQVSQISVAVNAGGSDPLYTTAATQMTPVTTFDDDSIELSVTLQAATGLIVGADGSGDVLITLTGDGLAVIEGTVNGVPVAGPFPASEISRLIVTGSDAVNSIDLSGVTPADFTFVSGLRTNVNSGRGNDVITGSPFGDFIVGAAGNDVINAGDGDDTVFGGAGKDALNGGTGNDSLSGQGGTGDSLTGGAGDDFLDGGAGNDLIKETVTGNLTLTNTTMVGLGNDTVVGVERANLQGGGAANVIDASGFFTPGLTSVSLYGGGGNDELIGSPGNDVLSGQGGNDSVLGGGGADRVFGGSGADRLNGQDGNDMVFGQGGSGDWLTGGAGDDLLNGGSGVDRLVESGSVGFVLTNSSLDGNGSDTLLAIESASLAGGAGDDVIDASAFSLSFVIVSGGAGNDTLIGGDTLNILNGRDGDDTLIGGPRNDRLRGHDGNDLIEGRGGNDVLEGGDGNDTLLGEDGDDTIDGGRGADGLSGAGGNDVLQGWKGADLVLGGSGDDTLEGDDGNDILIGGVGNDDLAGQNGVDILVRGNGTDPAEPGDIVDDLSEVDDVFMLMPFPGWIDTI